MRNKDLKEKSAVHDHVHDDENTVCQNEIHRHQEFEDSDDEDFGKPTGTLGPSLTATKMLLEDSDEE